MRKSDFELVDVRVVEVVVEGVEEVRVGGFGVDDALGGGEDVDGVGVGVCVGVYVGVGVVDVHADGDALVVEVLEVEGPARGWPHPRRHKLVSSELSK